MIKFLPFVLIAILTLAGLGYWRFFYTKQSFEEGSDTTSIPVINEPQEVPTILPSITPTPQKVTPVSSSEPALEKKVTSLEVEIADLKSRISTLENAPKSSPTSSSSNKVPVYIPIGAGGSNSNNNWANMPGYEISLDPGEYSGYSNMYLEVNMRLNSAGGNAMVRLTSSDGTAISSELSTPQTVYSLNTSLGFKLLSGRNTYKLQVKSSGGEMFIQDARIKVSF